MTIKEKAEQEGLSIEQVSAIAVDIGIDPIDMDRKLNAAEAIRLGKAMKNITSSDEPERKDASVLFWTTNTNYTIGKGIINGSTSVNIKNHALRLDAEQDKSLIKQLRRLDLTDVFEVFDEPFVEDSSAYYEFEMLLDELLFTGHTKEVSRMGVKTVRALFSNEELRDMEDNGFNAKRLKSKALRSRSVVRLANNGIK